MSVSNMVEATFGYAETQIVSFADLYAGKIVAALDRQHPRDLFDVRDLLANEGIDYTLRVAFLAYVISHNRPMAEILAPRRKDISQEFARGFNGMTALPVELASLLTAREEIISMIVRDMPGPHRKFLISFEQGEPEWCLIGLPEMANLPAVKWRQKNLDKLTAEKRATQVTKLTRLLLEDD